jgi:RHS repeat-associated protein
MLGTTRLITNYSAVAVQSPAFTAFGEPLPLTAAGGPVSQPNLGTRYAYVSGWGYQNDGTAISSKDIGMLHVGARYYDPSIGRFLQRDPLGVAGSLNFYGYANNCPTSVIDPTGNSSFDVAVGAGIIWGATFFFTEFNISLSEHGAIAATIMAALGILDATVIVPLTTWGLFKHICKDLVEFDGSFWLNAYTGGYLHVLGFSVGAYVGYLEAMMLSMSLGLW